MQQKSIKKNSIYNIIKTLSTIVIPLIIFPYVSRVLLPDNIGKVNWSKTFVNYFELIASLGISTYAIRSCSRKKDNKDDLNQIASEIFSINVLSTFFAYISLIVCLIVFRKADEYRTLIVIYSTTILFTTLGMDYINSAMEDFKYITLRTLFFQLLSLVLTLVFVRSKDDYITYMIISVVSSSGANAANILYRRRYCKVRFTLDIPWKTHLIPIITLFSMILSQVIFNNTDITMLGIMKNDYEVGIYSTALKIINIVAALVQSLMAVILPRLSLYFSKKDYDEINKLLKKLLVFNIGIGLPCVVGIEMLAPDIIYLVGGTEYISAAPVMRILILSFMFSLVGGSFLGNAVLIPSGRENYYMKVCWITAACNVGLNYLLIPRFGANGAAMATAFNGFIIFVLLLLNVDKQIKIDHPFDAFKGPMIGCAGIVVSCLALNGVSNFWFRLVFSIVTSVLVYAVTLILLKNRLATEALAFVRNRFHK